MKKNHFFFKKNNLYSDIKILEKLVSELTKPIVFTNGVFDILHVGHIRCLERSKNFGNSLIVAINSNLSVKKLEKGEKRPIIDELDRAEIISSLKSVDLCILFDHETPEALIKKIKPDIYTKGSDYNKDNISYANTLKQLKIKTYFIPLINNKSSTKIINTIINN